LKRFELVFVTEVAPVSPLLVNLIVARSETKSFELRHIPIKDIDFSVH